MDKKLKDLKDEVLVVTNAAEGNTPHVVEDIEPEGGLKTRPLAGAKPSDQFMRIDRNVSILETFFLNMKRQFERPSDFRFYHLPADLLASAKELVGLFKQPESNSALLDEYRLDTEQYVQSRQQAQQQSGGDGTEQSTRWSMEQVDWQQLERMGVTPETLGEPGLKRLLNGNESAVLTLKTVIEGIEFETPACIRLAENPDGTLRNEIECCKRYPELDTPYFNVEFTPEVKQNLLEKGNAGCVVELELAGGVREPCLVSLNPKTNRLHHIPVSGITIPAEVNGTALTDEQRKRIASGESVLVENMWSEKKQRHYDARLQFNGKYSINSLVYWVTYVHNVVYSFYRSMIYCYINSTQRCAGSIVIDIIPTNGADKRKFFPFAPYFPVTNVIKRYFYPYFPAIIGIKGYSFPYFPYLSGIMKIKTALYSLFSRLDWHKTVVFPCLGEIYEGIRSLSWEIPVT